VNRLDNDKRRAVTSQVAAVTGKRWCADHQGEHDAADGVLQQRGKRRGKIFVCNPCLAKKRKATK
jgi:hypothetical protein